MTDVDEPRAKNPVIVFNEGGLSPQGLAKVLRPWKPGTFCGIEAAAASLDLCWDWDLVASSVPGDHPLYRSVRLAGQMGFVHVAAIREHCQHDEGRVWNNQALDDWQEDGPVAPYTVWRPSGHPNKPRPVFFLFSQPGDLDSFLRTFSFATRSSLEDAAALETL